MSLFLLYRILKHDTNYFFLDNRKMLGGIASGRNIQTNRRRDFKSNFLHGGLSGYYSLIFTDFFTNVLKKQ